MNIRLFASALALCIAINARAQWSVINLHPTGVASAVARGVHDGKQVGESYLSGKWRASLWSGTAASWVNLHPAGATESFARGVGGGQQVGEARVGIDWHASLWSGTAASWVSLHPSGADDSYATGVSGTQQVGYAYVGGQWRASLWNGTAASWVDLTPTGAVDSRAYGTDGGQQVGYAWVSFRRASLWTGTAASWTNLHPTGSTESRAFGASGGQQVGWALVGGLYRASLWTGSAASWINLHPAGATESQALGVSAGQQVGWSHVAGSDRASLWSGTAASLVDLHAFLPVNFTSSVANGIWRDGNNTYVVGHGYNTTTDTNDPIMWVYSEPDNFTLALNKSSVAGQNSVLGTITMAETSTSNRVVTTYDNSSLVTTPPSVTVMAGQLTRNFQITTTAITSTVATTIFARRGSVTRTQTLTLLPLVPTAVVFTPNPVTGGNPTSCRVVINGVAGPGAA